MNKLEKLKSLNRSLKDKILDNEIILASNVLNNNLSDTQKKK